ncbi:urea transport system substrate-binding protein [Bradyrhizobium sp. i1.7.7]
MLNKSTHDIAASFSRRGVLAATAGLMMGLASLTGAKAADDTIKVGVLHSLSGTMAISETTLKDTILFLIDEQNKKGGVNGKKLEAVVVDPASNWPLFAEKARELITKDKVAVVFGCWTSVSRKSVLPVFKELNSILFYPVQYEGEESERNVFYTGAAPNQQAIPAVDYLMKDEKVKRWVLAGTDYVYPRTTNKILEAYLKSKGVAQEDIMINYTPFGHSDWQTIVADIKKFGSAGKKTAVVSTINGDANVPFYKELGNQGIKAKDIPVVAFSVGEEELAGIDTKPLLGHLAAWNYFQSIKSPENEKFIKAWQTYTKNPKRVTNDPMEAHVIGFDMWVKAVEKVKSTDPDKVIDALPGIEAKNLTGGTSKMLPNHHITKPVFIGVNQSQRPVRRGVEDPGSCRRRRLVEGARWLQGPGRRLGRQEVRQLQHQDQQVPRLGLLIPICRFIARREEAAIPPPSPHFCRGDSKCQPICPLVSVPSSSRCS